MLRVIVLGVTVRVGMVRVIVKFMVRVYGSADDRVKSEGSLGEELRRWAGLELD